MTHELIIFTTPANTQGVLRLDGGIALNSHPAVFLGRQGIGFTCPDATPNGNGAELTLLAANKVTIRQRAILWIRVPDFIYPWVGDQQAAFAIDDFTLPDVPGPVIPPGPIGDKHPQEIIQVVYNTGLYNLTTHDGCGQFTEACCTALHEQHSSSWGHVRKQGAQEQYNGHAIDAVMLLNSMPDCDRAIYDIIVQSQAPDAHPGFNFASPVNASLWYYPA